jgi:hypothetical protein
MERPAAPPECPNGIGREILRRESGQRDFRFTFAALESGRRTSNQDRHCEEHCDEANQHDSNAALDCFPRRLVRQDMPGEPQFAFCAEPGHDRRLSSGALKPD